MNDVMTRVNDLFRYPGQLSAIACFVVDNFSTLEEALEGDDLVSYCKALASSKVPGSGGTVGSALNMLKMIKHGKKEEARSLEDRIWAGEADVFDKDCAGVKAIPELREILAKLLIEKWGWNTCPPEHGAATGSEPDWKTMAKDCLHALRLFNDHYTDLSKSNPGFIGKLCLQDYALLNEAMITSNRTLSKYQDVLNAADQTPAAGMNP
jgi:hypothetical protein